MGMQWLGPAAAGAQDVTTVADIQAYLAIVGVPRKVVVDVPAGSTTATVTHDLDNTNVIVQIIDKVSKTVVLHEESSRTNTTVVLLFAVAPTTGQYSAIIVG